MLFRVAGLFACVRCGVFDVTIKYVLTFLFGPGVFILSGGMNARSGAFTSHCRR